MRTIATVLPDCYAEHESIHKLTPAIVNSGYSHRYPLTWKQKEQKLNFEFEKKQRFDWGLTNADLKAKVSLEKKNRDKSN